MHFSLFVLFPSVKNYLVSKGVDPNTVYLNDFKFMSRILNVLINVFGYKPQITIHQFFKYGFAEQKMILCCDAISLVKKAARDIRVKRSLSRKRSQTNRTASAGSFSIYHNTSQVQKDFKYERDNV
eukprot:CAMPEP_0170542532 /NCGR_PEP_ID=MMETSP0211-20121228/1932_1 /TAXON_ID=311385 /ORGANISM="Pseudokeronopsis sp., Strain OXSARD2" /LENGTH=125 /DNA_ID=CAMNT_0010845625 /DNA_START=256 /DNA_END=633 /DNA_ORIENTATION=+